MSSSGSSSGMRHRRPEKQRGIPRTCRCGEKAVIRTSKTVQNPGRLFHCCLYGSEKDTSHLFKWTDESMVEEMEEVECVVEKLKGDMGSLEEGLRACESEIGTLECETRTCEAVLNCCKKDIKEIKACVHKFEKEIGDMKVAVNLCEKELRSLKNIIVCGLIMYVGYLIIIR